MILPKAELHVHLEGTLTPSMVRQLAKKNKLAVPEAILGPDETFVWDDFLHFLKAYDDASAMIRVPEDYRDITYDYLVRCANEGAIYVEMMVSPDHGAMSGLSYIEQMDAVSQGIDDARDAVEIEGRIITTGVRHFGIESCENVAKLANDHPYPYVVGFGMAGDEINHPPAPFVKAFQMACEAGLRCTVHAGEVAGPKSMWDAINHLPIERIGHGVRAAEDVDLMKALVDKNISLEVCPGSNIALDVFKSFEEHTFPKLYDAGIKLTLNSDDPPHFATTIGREYDIAQQYFDLNDEALIQITRNAIDVSFADEATKQKLYGRLDNWKT